jgi:hypothetical protein
MGVKSHFNETESQRDLDRQYRVIKKKIIAAFNYAGIRFLQEARGQPGDHSKGFYQDVTGNLRNSIQYFIFEDGKLLDNSESAFTMQNLAEIRSLVKFKGIQLIGIAGMNYASSVEAKGYNVIAKQADMCIILIDKYLTVIEDAYEQL